MWITCIWYSWYQSGISRKCFLLFLCKPFCPLWFFWYIFFLLLNFWALRLFLILTLRALRWFRILWWNFLFLSRASIIPILLFLNLKVSRSPIFSNLNFFLFCMVLWWFRFWWWSFSSTSHGIFYWCLKIHLFPSDFLLLNLLVYLFLDWRLNTLNFNLSFSSFVNEFFVLVHRQLQLI